MKFSEQQIRDTLLQFAMPELGGEVITAKAIQSIQLKESSIAIGLLLGFPIASIQRELEEALKLYLQQQFQGVEINLELGSKLIAHATQGNVKAHPSIKNVLVIASGKGGVGKSTTAVNLALGLQAAGARVGLLDADIYGPNQPTMLGNQEKPAITEQKKFIPVERYGLFTNSIGYLVPDEKAMVWRGPMVSGALLQLFNDTEWPELDYLVIDMPPGTGDIQLTLAQKIAVSGAVIITTPQQVAVNDARKGIAMFAKVGVPVLGVVENMSYYRCSHCNSKEFLFGQGGGVQLAKEQQLPLLAELPFVSSIQVQADIGKPIVLAQPESEAAIAYQYLALKTTLQLAKRPANYAKKFPDIVVEG